MKQNILKLSLLSVATFFGFQSQAMELTPYKSKSTSFKHLPHETVREIAKNFVKTEDVSNLARTNKQCSNALDTPSSIKWWAKQFPGKRRKTAGSLEHARVNNGILKLCAKSKNGYNRMLYKELSESLYADLNYVGTVECVYGQLPARGTQLLFASYCLNEELVGSSLQKGTNPNLTSGLNGDTPLAAVCRSEGTTPDLITKQHNIIDRLVERNADINHTKKTRSYIHQALIFNNDSLIRTLINNGINPNHQDYNGDTPLMLLIKSDRMKNKPSEAQHDVQNLMQKGTDPNIRNKHGETPLSCCRNGTFANPAVEKIIKNQFKTIIH